MADNDGKTHSAVGAPLVIYHANCFDGITAAWVARKYFRDRGHEPEMKAAYYTEAAPDVKGRAVYIVDFSYPREVLTKMYEEAALLVVLDHHKTAKEALEGLPFCKFDMTKSGAMLAWEFFFPEQNYPGIVAYMQDYDLWKFEMYKSREFHAYCSTLNKNDIDTIEALSVNFGMRFEEYAKVGKVILEYNEMLVKLMCKNPIWLNFHGHLVLASFGNTTLKDGIGARLAEMNTKTSVGLSINMGTEGRVALSFRSCRDGNAGAIAEALGSGGHRHAAGAGMSYEAFTYILKEAIPFTKE